MKVLGKEPDRQAVDHWPKKFSCCGHRLLAEKSDLQVGLFNDDYSGSEKTAWLYLICLICLICPICRSKHLVWPEEYEGDPKLEGMVMQAQYRHQAEKTAARQRESRW